MSLSSAISIARSGLNANRKWSELTGRNIANANTEGYVRKDIQFSTSYSSPNHIVYVSEIRREADTSLEKLYRLEASKMNQSQTVYEGIEEYTAYIGQPNDERSLSYKLSQFESSFVELSNNPGSGSVQRAFLNEAQSLASDINHASSNLGEIQSQMEIEIEYVVADINEILYKLQSINDDLYRFENTINTDATELYDEQARLLDSLSENIDIRWNTNAQGQVSVYTSNGTPLLAGNDVEQVSYNKGTGQVFAGTLEMTPRSATIRGFESGKLGGLFDLKQDILPRFQLQLDETARVLIENFEAADASRAPGDAGLFTDGSSAAAFNIANLDGLASRITVNSRVIPEQGGELYRLRDGVGAAAPGSAGDATQINAWMASLDAANTYDPNAGLPDNISVKSFVNNMIAAQQTERADAEKSFISTQSTASIIESSRASLQGVNIDDELQKLILIEQSYAANSQVISSVNRMLDDLMNTF